MQEIIGFRMIPLWLCLLLSWPLPLSVLELPAVPASVLPEAELQREEAPQLSSQTTQNRRRPSTSLPTLGTGGILPPATTSLKLRLQSAVVYPIRLVRRVMPVLSVPVGLLAPPAAVNL